MNKLRSYS